MSAAFPWQLNDPTFSQRDPQQICAAFLDPTSIKGKVLCNSLTCPSCFRRLPSEDIHTCIPDTVSNRCMFAPSDLHCQCHTYTSLGPLIYRITLLEMLVIIQAQILGCWKRAPGPSHMDELHQQNFQA
jgi:hypothetical protein